MLKTYLTTEQRKALAQSIAQQERRCDGEIRVVLRHRRHWNERKLTFEELALKEFQELGMQNTRHRTGVLIFLLISDRRFRIVADEGIHAKVPEGTWDAIALALMSNFRGEKYFEGLTDAVATVGDLLASHFPASAGDMNELPNDVVEE